MPKLTIFLVALLATLAGHQTSALAAGLPYVAPPGCALPAQSYRMVEKTILVPTVVQERRRVQVTEYRTETRQRTVMTYQHVPETQTVTEQYVECVPEVRSRTETFVVRKPVTRQVAREVVVHVPYQETRQATRRVCRYVPATETRTIQVPEQRTRTETYTVCQPVMRQVQQRYTVNVPYTEMREGTRRVCRWVPVTETRNVVVDRGHFETVCWQVPVSCCNACGRRGLFRRRCCEPACCTTMATVSKQVWVPHCVVEQRQVTVHRLQSFDEKYTFPVTVCRPEERTRTVQVCEMVPQQQTREVPYVVCVPKEVQVTVERPQMVDEPYQYTVTLCRQEKRQVVETVCDYVDEPQTRTVNTTVMVPQTRSRQRQVTVMKCVAVPRTETYSVCVPYCVEREVLVNVCRMVPKTVQVCVPCGGL